MVNYDEIKRFIRQEIIKMFDGNWQPAGWQWVLPALPETSLPCFGLLFLKAQCPPALTLHTLTGLGLTGRCSIILQTFLVTCSVQR